MSKFKSECREGRGRSFPLEIWEAVLVEKPSLKFTCIPVSS